MLGMRILFLTQWFDPEPFYKGLALARQLVHLGHEVEVLTGFPNYPGGKVYPGYVVRPWSRETTDGVSVIRVALYPSHDDSAIKRVANYASFAFSSSVLGACLARRPDVVYAYHPPGTVGLSASCLAFAKRAPLVYDIQDMWPDSLAATGMFDSGIGLKAVGALMSRVYKRATKLVVLSPGFRRLLVERGVPDEKIRVIYNWSPDEQDDSPVSAPSRDAERSSRAFTVVFAGNMGRAQGLEAVLEAADILRERAPEVRIVFVGTGVCKDELEKEARALGLTNTEFRDPVPREQIGGVLNSADALLVHLKDDPLFAVTIPSKTQSYLMAGRPIVMGVRGDAAALVTQAGAGVACQPEDPNSIAQAIMSISSMDPGERSAMGAAGRDYYWQHLSLSRGAREIESVLKEAARCDP